MKILIEGLGLCVLLFLFCLIGIRNGAVGLIHLYEKDVQQRAIAQGLTTAEKIRKNAVCFKMTGAILYMAYPLICVYAANGTRGFWTGFWLLTSLFLMMGVFDRIGIDVIWVGHTKAWEIPGTEDLKPYIPFKIHLKKWITMLVLYPAVAAVLSGIMALILKS